MPAVARDLEITYGSYVIGGGTDKLPDASAKRLRIAKRYLGVSVEFDFWVTASSYPNFKTACDDAEASLSKPRQRLIVKLGATTMFDYDPTKGASTNTGFDAAPEIEKIGDTVGDTGLSRKYTARISLSTPADLSGQNGRGDSTVEVFFSPTKRRTVTITGFYTALGANDARAQYDANIGAYASSVLTALGGTYNLVDEVAGPRNDTDKRIEFRRVYKEILLGQSASALDDPDIHDQVLTVVRMRVGPGDTPGSGAERLHELAITYFAWLDKTTVTDPKATYESKSRPWILQHLSDVFGASSTAIVEEKVDVDEVEWTVSAALRIMAVAGSAVLSHAVVREISEQAGKVFIPVWNGDPLAAHVFDGHTIRLRTTTVTTIRLGAVARGGLSPAGGGANQGGGAFSFFGQHDAPAGGLTGALVNGSSDALGFFGAHPNSGPPSGAIVQAGGNAGQKPAAGADQGGPGGASATGEAGWIPIHNAETTTPRRLGLPDTGGLIDVTETTQVLVERFVTDPSGGSGSRVPSGLGASVGA